MIGESIDALPQTKQQAVSVRCGFCVLSHAIAASAKGGDPSMCLGPQPFSRDERVATKTGIYVFGENGWICPTYQAYSDGYIEYDLD